MRRTIRLALCLTLLGCQHTAPRAINTGYDLRKVQIISEDSTALDAYLFIPSGNGPFPVVVGLHGCAGMFTKNGELNPREVAWGKYLATNGFVVLYPDSFTSRSIKEICTRTDMPDMALKIRPKDSYGALRWLQKQPFADATQAALMGWSNGGSSLLWTIADKPNYFPEDLTSDFRIAIAVYPGCNTADRSKKWANRVPLEIHIGTDDDWASPGECQSLIGKLDQSMATITLYPDSRHDFDAPNLPLTTIRNLTYPTKHSGYATVGTNELSRKALMNNILAALKTKLIPQ